MPIRERLAAKEIHRDFRRLRAITSSGGGIAPHPILGVSHNDAAVAAPIQGSLIVANDTPEWDILEHPAASGYALVTTDTDTEFDISPTWEGRHSWDDGGGVTAYIDEDGSADFDGHVAIGDAATVATAYALYVDEQFTDVAGTVAGQYVHVDFAPGGNFATDVYGDVFEAELTTAHARTGGGIYGVFVRAFVANAVAASDLNLIGGQFLTDIEDAAAIVGVGVDAYTPYVDAGSSTLGYGVRILEGTVGAGSIGTLYGLYIAEISAGTASWSIYSDGGDSYHEDRVKVGGNTTISAQLHVDQSSGTGGQPAVFIDQGDTSEYAIVVSSDGADQNINVLAIDVTGTPAFVWIEAGDALYWNKHFVLSAGDLYFASTFGIIHADGVAVGQILVADGTRYVPGTIADAGGAPDDAQYVVMALDGDLSAERVLTGGDGISLTDGGANGNATLAVDLVAAWSGLEFSGGQLRIDLDATFNSWTGEHTFDNNVYIAEYLYHAGDLDTFMRYQLDRVTFEVGGVAFLDMIEAATDYAWFGVDVDINGNDLVIDADGDTFLHESADDVVELYLATASGELDITINGAVDFTFTANAFNVAAGSAIYLSEYMYHAGDLDTYLRYQTDNITLRAGGVDMVDIVEGATDYVSINGTTIDPNFTAQLYVMDGKMGVSYSGAEAVYHAFAYGNDASYYPIWRGRRARDTRGSESAAQADDILGRLGSGGYGATGFNAASTGYLQLVAAENFTDADMGTHTDLYSTPTGSTTAVRGIRLAASGRVKMGDDAAAISGQLHVHQDSATGAIPVFYMEQDDVDQPFTRYQGTAAAATLTNSIVAEADVTTATRQGFVKVYVQDDGNQITDQAYYMPIYTLA